ncbi:PucR family transcriptional regulator ligand-binding domain-containing protein [Cytobacillus sp.]|uniref:PucR family transcriptional regulator n=1 Tax=Cytobacillus sp. TaxID=2675269 RepID=UPI0028BDAB84|nr:PucR family transcriptional regulator ligand-binding domain-containing protein [Cytobacillus sp.]
MKLLEDLFIVDVFQEAEVLAGSTGLKRRVDTIEISETPDVFHFMAENSLLLTTGYAFQEDPRKLSKLIAELNDRPCAGMAIKLKRFIDDIPDEVIKLANALEFPIIRIPESLTLGTVAHQLLGFLWDNKIEELFYAIHVHKKFTNMMMKGYKLQTLIENLGTLLKCPVLLLNPIGDIVSFSHHFEQNKMKNVKEEISSIFKSDIDQYREKNKLLIQSSHATQLKIPIHIFPVKTTRLYPFLLLIFDYDRLPYPSSQLAIEQASTVISFTLLKNEAIKENNRMLENNFFGSLVDGNITVKQEIIHRGKQHGLLEHQRYICIVCTIDKEKSADMMSRIYDYLNEYLKISFCRTEAIPIVFLKDAYFVILLQFPLNTIKPVKSLIADKLEKFQQEVMENVKVSLSFGAGSLVKEVTNIAITYSEAVEAWENGFDLFQYHFINFYETKQLKELMHLLPEQNIKKFYENTLRSLSYPKSKDEEDLLHTLIVYLDHHCEISKTAKKLFVHRNTVKYRIAKCEEILGYSVRDSENSLHLRMALMMRSMQSKSEVN